MVVWKVQASTGVLARAGKELKSAELQRVAVGSVLKEIALVGDRLNFQLMQGEGPSTGWVSVKTKDKDLVVRQGSNIDPEAPVLAKEVSPCTAEDLDLGPCQPPEERPYGIVVYGATGFSGQLAVQHLDALFFKEGGPKYPWAVAGRSAERLKTLQKLCKTKVATLVVATDEEVHKMVGQCRVVISAIGPHSQLGEPVIRACVAFRTHYVDISGEFWWMKRMITRYDKEARHRGVMLVIMCGQQASVADMGVHYLVKKLGPLRQVRAYVLQCAMTTGGTDFNGRYTMKVMMKNPEIFHDMRDPFALGGVRRGEVRDIDQDISAVEKDLLYPKFWLGPLGCAGVDCRILRRSCALFEEQRPGRDVRYGDDVAFIWREPSVSKAAAERLMQQFGPLPSPDHAPGAFQAMQQGLEQGQSPPRGQGPPKELRERFFINYAIVAEAESGQWATCRYEGGDPYEVTGMAAAVAALTLLEELEALNPQDGGGLVTPAFAFANSGFARRLQDTRWADSKTGAWVKWDVQDGQPAYQEIFELWKNRTAAFTEMTPQFQKGELKQWALPDYA